MVYGEQARYWLSTPDYATGRIDGRFAKNDGTTYIGSNEVNSYPEVDDDDDRYIDKVSAFLTGRSLAGVVSSSPTFSDDDPSDQFDDQLRGLFVVNNATNKNGNAATWAEEALENPVNKQQWKFNDLLMRRLKLCQFVNFTCGNPVLMQVTHAVSHIPFADGAH